MAVLIAAGSAAIGVTAAVAGPADAATGDIAGTPCGLPNTKCPAPTGTIVAVAPTSSGGPSAIRTKWTGGASDGRVSSVRVTVTWIPAAVPKGAVTPPAPGQLSDVVTAPCTPTGASDECDVAWPPSVTNHGTVLNGSYSVSATAATCPTSSVLGLPACSDDATVAKPSAGVANLPAPPANVASVLEKAPGTGVVVTWDTNPEPDVYAYKVIRLSGTQQVVAFGCAQAFAPAGYKALPRCGTAKTLTGTDPKPGGGVFTYEVLAFRFGATYADEVISKPAQAKAPLTVAGPPAANPGGVPIPGVGGPTFGGVFNAAKPRAQSGAVIAPVFPNLAPTAPATTDPGFNPTLPYGDQPAVTDPPTVAAAAAPKSKGSNSVGSIALVGAGLLVIVVALHGLWLRGEVKRAGTLEALEPEL